MQGERTTCKVEFFQVFPLISYEGEPGSVPSDLLFTGRQNTHTNKYKTEKNLSSTTSVIPATLLGHFDPVLIEAAQALVTCTCMGELTHTGRRQVQVCLTLPLRLVWTRQGTS